MRPPRSALAAFVSPLLFVLTLGLAASPAIALQQPDNKAPTRPRNLRVTGIDSYSVSLSWHASNDIGPFSYVIESSSGYSMTVPQSSTSANFIGGLWPHNSYSFSVHAIDTAGNRSNSSNTVRTTQPADNTVPTTPSVTVTDIGPHHASFSWSATDNDPYLSYFLYINGSQVGHSTIATSGTFYLPEADTAYTFAVKARDHGINFSGMSAPVIFTTDPVDPSDTEPPTTPAAFDAYNNGDLEFFLTWTQSTDNVDAQQAIRYEIYINGELAESVVGTGATTSYGELGLNIMSIIAIDSAGNESAPVTITTEI